MTPTELKEFRATRGWSQRELARRIGKTQNAIVKYESDGAEVPKGVALACLAWDYDLIVAGMRAGNAVSTEFMDSTRRRFDAEAAT